MFSGKKRRIGVSDRNHLSLKKLRDMYPTWPGDNVKVHLDAGLIRIDDKRDWTTQVAGMGGPLAEWIDITPDTLTVDVIDSRVRAFGAASGELRGRIAGLFYRYSTAGGVDYVTELLIRPESIDAQGTQHGDSGTLWFFEEREHEDSAGAGRPASVRDAVGRTRLGRRRELPSRRTVCARDLPEHHLPRAERLARSRLEHQPGILGTGRPLHDRLLRVPGPHGQAWHADEGESDAGGAIRWMRLPSRTKINEKGPSGLVPLADVPDRMWAHGKTMRGGADKPNHFADMDKPDPLKGNKTLLSSARRIRRASTRRSGWSTTRTSATPAGTAAVSRLGSSSTRWSTR